MSSEECRRSRKPIVSSKCRALVQDRFTAGVCLYRQCRNRPETNRPYCKTHNESDQTVTDYRPDVTNGVEEYDERAHLSQDTMNRIQEAINKCDNCLSSQVGTTNDRAELQACRSALERAQRGWTFRAGYATGALTTMGAGLVASQWGSQPPDWGDAPAGVYPPS